jgi:hypothetical protein
LGQTYTIFLSTEWAAKGQYVISNFKRSKGLDAAMTAMLDFFETALGSATGADQLLAQGLVLQERCLAEFDACVAALDK